MTRPHSFRSLFIVGVGYSFVSTWIGSERHASCWPCRQRTFRMEMQDRACLLDHLLCDTHPRPSRNNPVGILVALAISHIFIGLHSQTLTTCYPISHALVPNNIMKVRFKQPNQLNNTVMEMANRLANHTLYYVCCLVNFGQRDRRREEKRHVVME